MKLHVERVDDATKGEGRSASAASTCPPFAPSSARRRRLEASHETHAMAGVGPRQFARDRPPCSGRRSTFRDWGQSAQIFQPQFPNGTRVSDKTVAAYNRSDLFERKRWLLHCAKARGAKLHRVTATEGLTSKQMRLDVQKGGALEGALPIDLVD